MNFYLEEKFFLKHQLLPTAELDKHQNQNSWQKKRSLKKISSHKNLIIHVLVFLSLFITLLIQWYVITSSLLKAFHGWMDGWMDARMDA